LATKKLSKSTLRWFIGTKSLMPIVEIRRRFGINGDEVTVLEDGDGKLFVGLPLHAAEALEDLRQQGKIGYELSADLNARVLVGAYTVHRKGGDGRLTHKVEPDGAEDAA
jgi:hypothetical protein